MKKLTIILLAAILVLGYFTYSLNKKINTVKTTADTALSGAQQIATFINNAIQAQQK